MAHIPEPKNVDFIIESPPLSDKERDELSEFIKQIKAESDQKKKRNPRLDKTKTAKKA